MSLITRRVAQVLKPPYRRFSHWWVDVRSEFHGEPNEHKLMFRTEQAAKAVGAGYQFLA